jgi:hypothetical protein
VGSVLVVSAVSPKATIVSALPAVQIVLFCSFTGYGVHVKAPAPIFHGFACGPSAAFAAYDFRFWVIWKYLLPPMRRCYFTSLSLNPSVSTWAAAL